MTIIGRIAGVGRGHGGGKKGEVIKNVLKHFIALNLETTNHNRYLPPAPGPPGCAILQR